MTDDWTHTLNPKYQIGSSVVFYDSNGDVVVLGQVAGARFRSGEWHYTVYCDSARGEMETFEIIQSELFPWSEGGQLKEEGGER